MAGDRLGFHVADYVVFGLSVLISLGIGVFYGVRGRKKQTTEEYLVGSRNMRILPVAMSLVVTFESSIFMMGVPAEVYYHGIQWALMSFAWCFNLLFAAYAYIPMIHALKITSSFEYLELRYGKWYVRIIGSFLQILYNLIYMGVVLYGPALVLEGALGVPVYASVLLIGIISVVYTSVVRIHVSLYSIHMQEWMRVYKRKEIFIIRTEDYKKDIVGTLRSVIKFLDLDSYPESILEEVSRQIQKYATKRKNDQSPMRNDTKKLLDDYFAPYNRRLAEILNDQRFLWNE